MFQLGAGYFPKIFEILPASVDWIELGLTEANHLAQQQISVSQNLSLHVARSPIIEDERLQDEFIQQCLVPTLERLKRSTHLKCPQSIAFHLTGKRADGIGKYGFSSHYHADSSAESAATKFVKKVREQLCIEVWLENSNLYSTGSREFLEGWASYQNIVRTSGAGMIVDLAHLIISAHNVGLPSQVALGVIDWTLVREIHLSGIVEGSDGTWHDGHSLPVHSDCWQSLRIALRTLIPPSQSVVLTIEHTDPSWFQRPGLLNDDFSRLEALLRVSNESWFTPPTYTAADRAETYALNYLKKIILKRIPLLATACQERSIQPDQLFDAWIQDIAPQRLSLTEFEILESESQNVHDAVRSFHRFAIQNLGGL